MRYLRSLYALPFFLCCLVVSPAFAQQTGVQGVVVNYAGAPLADAKVSVYGPHTASTTTDAQGRFSVTLPPGVYSITATRPGYEQVTVTSIVVTTGVAEVQVALPPVSLSSLTTIARVVSAARSQFNAGSYPVSVLSSQTFIQQGAINIEQVINEIPGIVAARPQANAAVPGSTVSPNLRGALDYEKETLIDGHPLINGSHGDYPVMLVDSLLFDDIEIAKGPSAYASEIYYGIGGTMNFRTGDPTLQPEGRAIFGFDNEGGLVGNIRDTGTSGRFGWVIDLADYGTYGPLRNYGSYFAVAKGTTIPGYGKITGTTTSGTSLNGQTGPYPIANSVGSPTNAYSTLIACCQRVTSDYLTQGEVARFYYHFSNNTVFDIGYVGIQGNYDGPSGSFSQFDTTFSPTASYIAPGGPFQPGDQVQIAEKSTFPDSQVWDSEPMFESNLRSTLGNDTVLARYYSEVYLRYTLSDIGSPSANYTTGPFTLYGTAAINGASTPTAFIGTVSSLTFPTPYSDSVEHDILHGYSFEDDHPIGNGQLTFEYDHTTALTNAWSVVGSATKPDGLLTTSIAAGTRQDFITYLLRGTFNLGERATLTVANYYDVYNTHYTPEIGPDFDYIFTNATVGHDDPRVGLSYRASPDAIIRFTAGSALAPAYPSLTNALNETAAEEYVTGDTSVTITKNPGSLQPETSFGYDIGTDTMLPFGAIVSFDAYLTNLKNQFDTLVSPNGTYTPPGGSPIPVYESTTVNLGNSRYEGLELALHDDPVRGFGYVISGDLQKAYPYDIPACFYATAAHPCPGYGTNLLVIPYINFQGSGTGYNGVGNKSEAYAMGYASVHERGGAGQYAEVGVTYFGNNNTYDVPPFFVTSASYRVPLGIPGTTIQVSADNIFNQNNGSYLVGYNTAIPTPLINGEIGLRNAVPYGPTTVRVMVAHNF